MSKKLLNNAPIILILLWAAFLRFYNWQELPFWHDEFSALFRTGFTDFETLIKEGVLVDFHPAGIQVFLNYWVGLFGEAPFMVKLPFLLMGVGSSWLVYVIGVNWFTKTSGLIAASYLASLQFFILHSQSARPYISGVFFILLMVYFLTRWLITPKGSKTWNIIGYIVAASLCNYNHMFSILLAFLIGVSGFLFSSRRELKSYLLANLAVILLYIPHVKVFLYQMNKGGISSWLGKPSPDFLPEFLHYLFHFSWWVWLVLLITFLVSFSYRKAKINLRLILICIAWFTIPYAIAHIYSLTISSVLVNRILIFGTPFLLLAIFSFTKKISAVGNLILVLLILGVNSFSLFKERMHYTLFYNEPDYEVLEMHHTVHAEDPSIFSIIESHPKITKYLVAKNNINPNFFFVDSLFHLSELTNQLKSTNASQVFLGSVRSSNTEIINVVRNYFPHLKWQKNYSSGEGYLFTKGPPEETLYINCLASDTSLSTVEWSKGFELSWNEVFQHTFNEVNLNATLKTPFPNTEFLLTASLLDGDSLVFWTARSSLNFMDNDSASNNVQVYLNLKLNDMRFNEESLTLRVSIWNRERVPFNLSELCIKTVRGNPVYYGLDLPILYGIEIDKTYP